MWTQDAHALKLRTDSNQISGLNWKLYFYYLACHHNPFHVPISVQIYSQYNTEYIFFRNVLFFGSTANCTLTTQYTWSFDALP